MHLRNAFKFPRPEGRLPVSRLRPSPRTLKLVKRESSDGTVPEMKLEVIWRRSMIHEKEILAVSMYHQFFGKSLNPNTYQAL